MEGLSLHDMETGECVLSVLSDGKAMQRYATIGMTFGNFTFTFLCFNNYFNSLILFIFSQLSYDVSQKFL